MMTDRHNSLRDEAIEWAIRLGDPAFGDWEGFTAWLGADPAHLAAYDAVVAAGEAADPSLRALPQTPATPARPETATPERKPRARWAAGGLIAAAIVGGLGWAAMSLRPAPYAIETGPGEHRIVSIGTATIALNGDTRLRLDHHDPHVATLERGEALFDVRHDEKHPFAVRVGDDEVQDVGTRFDVTREGEDVRVAVAEGSVVYNPRGEAVHLGPGQQLAAAGDASTLHLTRTAVADIGGWREDRLSYEQAPLATVAADLSRGLGVDVEAAPDVAHQRFTGVIAYGGDKTRFLAGLGPLLDVGVEHGHQRWLLIRKPESRP
jgi:transmembrane sensor